ncbi:MAG: flagellar biosynthesis protein FlhB [Hyphomonadaceae bacterium]|jgi:flagellar biosynthetic protein FlhB|nr:flagellar biosynthesis protein FlhB [Hyphomonadaceae bacterium]
MAEGPDKDSKTEEATEKKLRDAVEKGNVPFSREAATLASLMGMAVIASFFLAGSVGQLNFSLARLIDNAGGWRLENRGDAVRLLEAIGLDAVRLLLPVVVILTVVGVMSSFLQNSPRLVLDRIAPKLSRLSISQGWSRIFGGKGQVEFLKAVVKLVAVCVLGFLLLRAAQYDILNAMFMEPSALPSLILSIGTRLVMAIAVATIVLVAADLVWTRVFWAHDLRMTRQEVKDEMKQVDGDPLVKARLRSLARDRARKRMIAAVPRATFVITNPTHYAVALRYVKEEGGAPLVVAKGQDLIALKIREIATEHSIPIIEDKLLARSLYKAVEVDKMIPPEFYKAVAEIVFFLFQRRGGAPGLAG